jgi:DNA polymerase III subunit delta
MAKKAANQSFEPDASQRIVVLHGPERFLIHEHTKRLADALRGKFGEIETFTFDGETVTPAVLLDELRSYGLMQRHKLVILDNAELFLAGGGKRALENEDEANESGGDDGDGKGGSRRPLMERYAENPVDDATLLLRANFWRAGKLDKLIAKSGAIVACELANDATAAGWCVKRCEKRYDATIESAAAALLVQRHGPSLQHLDTELARLSLMAGPGGVITKKLVAEAVEPSREEKAWEIQAAALTGSAPTMLAKLHELVQVSRHDVIPLNWSIIDLLRKLHAAAHLIKRGVPTPGIASQLRLWPSADPVVALARRAEPRVFAQLLRDAVRVDQAAKSGGGEPVRNLEAFLVKMADRLKAG